MSKIEIDVAQAVRALRGEGYGVTIGDEVEARTGRSLSTGALYAALYGLEERGFVVTRQGEATPERGWRHKVHYTLTDGGLRALSQALCNAEAERSGVTPAGLGVVRRMLARPKPWRARSSVGDVVGL